MPDSLIRNLAVASVAAILLAGVAIAQTSLDAPLDEHSAKRLDRLEAAVREIRAIVFQGRETGQPVVVQPAETEPQIAGLTDRLNDLDHSLTRLNGENDVFRHDLDEARREDLDLHTANDALKAKVSALEREVLALATPQAPPPPPPAAASAAPAPTAAEAFANARALMQSGDNASAQAAWQAFIDKYGDTPRGAEARYFLGRVLLDQQAFADAATAEIGAIRGWPQTTWAPAAVVDLARALVGMNKNQDACETLDELAKRYPKATASVATGAAEVRSQARCGG